MNARTRLAAAIAVSTVLVGLTFPTGASADVANPLEWLSQAPDTLVLTDFNADNKVDIATGGPCEARVLLGNGDGTYAPSKVVATFVGCHGASGALDWGDIDNDGKLDLVWAPGYGSVYVIRGKGDGTFEAPVTYTGDPAQETVAVGDLNGDQRDDVVLADFGGPVSVYKTQVDGTFAAPVTYGSFTSASTSAVALADYNGDGKLDVAVGDSPGTPGGGVAILLGNGDGTLQTAKTTSAERPVRLRAIVGLGGDNFDDLIYVGGSSMSNLLTLAQSVGDGTLQLLGSADLGRSIWDFDLLDADHNGTTDVAMALFGTGVAELLIQPNGDGMVVTLPFARAASPPASAFGTPQRVAAGDLNGDGYDDLVTVVSAGTAGGGTIGVVLSLPSLSVEPGSLTFDSTQVGSSSATKTVTLTGAAPRPGAVGTVGLAGANAADFAIVSDGCSGRSLAVGQSCAVGVRFSPAGDGSRAASLVVPSNDAAGSKSVGLSGSATPVAQTVAPVVADTTAPALVKLGVLRDRLARVLAKGLRVRLTYSENATVSITLTMARKPGRGVRAAALTKPVVVGTAKASLMGSKPATVVVKLAKRVARSLKRQKSVVFTLTVRAKDAAGNKSTPSVRRVTVRR